MSSTNPDQLFPDHPALVVSRSVGRSLYSGIAEVITRDELRQQRIMQDDQDGVPLEQAPLPGAGP